jgi:hypothetical protein
MGGFVALWFVRPLDEMLQFNNIWSQAENQGANNLLSLYYQTNNFISHDMTYTVAGGGGGGVEI